MLIIYYYYYRRTTHTSNKVAHVRRNPDSSVQGVRVVTYCDVTKYDVHCDSPNVVDTTRTQCTVDAAGDLGLSRTALLGRLSGVIVASPELRWDGVSARTLPRSSAHSLVTAPGRATATQKTTTRNKTPTNKPRKRPVLSSRVRWGSVIAGDHHVATVTDEGGNVVPRERSWCPCCHGNTKY